MDNYKICRFCLENSETISNPLIAPCNCKGSIEFLHLKCLFRWMYGQWMYGYLRDECNMCNAVYTYSITALEEIATPINQTFYHATSTPVSAIATVPILLIGNILIHPSSTLIGFHSFTAAIYVYSIYINIKHPIRYIYYYFKDWSIHLLALITVFIMLNRNININILVFYHCLGCCVWYTTHKVDHSIRSSINHRIYKELLSS